MNGKSPGGTDGSGERAHERWLAGTGESTEQLSRAQSAALTPQHTTTPANPWPSQPAAQESASRVHRTD